jgi:ribose 5-phosphate isomerase B
MITEVQRMRIAIGCDEAAYELKEILRQHVAATGAEVEDYGTFDATPVLYPDVAFAVAEAVAAGKHDRAILLCGTGIGMAISANKVAGIRAAQAHDTYSAGRARMSNDAQIVTIGARVIGAELAKAIVDTFLASDFQGAKSADKIARITAYESTQVADARGTRSDR